MRALIQGRGRGSVRWIPIAGVAGALLLATIVSSPARAQTAPDGCDPNEAVACLIIPSDPNAPADSGPGRAAAPQGPGPNAAIAAPAPPPPTPGPVPCAPFAVDVLPPEAAIAIPAPQAPLPPPPPISCGYQNVVAAVNAANVAYVRALRTLDTRNLSCCWSDGALSELRRQVSDLRGQGLYATPQLLSITLREIRPGRGVTTVRTVEHWIYEQRTRWSGDTVYWDDQWVENVYTLQFRNGRWLVIRDDVSMLGPSYPYPVYPPFHPGY